jgi:alpha-beta hydrolase superfamily lysophospholipase
MEHFQGRVLGAGGLELFYQGWSPGPGAKASLGLLHGLGSHSGWFTRLVLPLVQAGYEVYGLDLRGHGRSPGRRGYVQHWQDFRQDLANFHQLILRRRSEWPCFLGGHSLGATIILDYALQCSDPPVGVIAIAPAIGLVGISPVKLAIGKVMSRLWPTLTLDTGIPKNAGSHDWEILAAYADDPLRHTKGTARLVTEFLRTTNQLRIELGNIQVPLLILQGDEDIVALPASTRNLFAHLPAMINVEYREYAHGYHDLHNDTCSSQIAMDMIAWMNHHIDSKIPWCVVR